jgi:hypothetical protein
LLCSSITYKEPSTCYGVNFPIDRSKSNSCLSRFIRCSSEQLEYWGFCNETLYSTPLFRDRWLVRLGKTMAEIGSAWLPFPIRFAPPVIINWAQAAPTPSSSVPTSFKTEFAPKHACTSTSFLPLVLFLSPRAGSKGQLQVPLTKSQHLPNNTNEPPSPPSCSCLHQQRERGIILAALAFSVLSLVGCPLVSSLSDL